MADRARRPILRAGDNEDRRPTLGLVAPSGEILPVASGAPRLAAPERAPILLSPARDLIGITPRAWLAVAAFYCALAGVALYLDWRAVPPEPWPDAPAVFTVIFEQPPPAPPEPEAKPAPPEAATPPEPLPPPEAAQPPPEPPPPEPPPVIAEKPLPPETAEVPPPPPKPEPPRVRRTVAAAKPTPSAPVEPSPAVTAENAPKAPPQTQVAALPIVPPRAITGLASNRKPDYPADARRRGIQGNVLLHVDVTAAGAALRVIVATSSGHDMLDDAALRAVQQWRFSPATQGGVAVAGAVDVPVHFRLEE
jgi:protein TonB